MRKELFLVAASIFGILIVVGVALYFFRGSLPTATDTLKEQGIRIPPLGSRIYKNERFAFSLFYPEELIAAEHYGQGGALTIAFQREGGAYGFQIFITPYEESQITQEQFLQDVPTGVREEPVDIEVGGVLANKFFSEHLDLGQTREIWFIKDNYLYEITTYRELDKWLQEIVQTWEF